MELKRTEDKQVFAKAKAELDQDGASALDS